MKTMLSEPAEVTTSPFFQKNCTRCSGQMTHELCIDIQSDSGRTNFWAFRCIQCGDIVDEVILQNRSRSVFGPNAMLAVEAVGGRSVIGTPPTIGARQGTKMSLCP